MLLYITFVLFRLYPLCLAPPAHRTHTMSLYFLTTSRTSFPNLPRIRQTTPKTIRPVCLFDHIYQPLAIQLDKLLCAECDKFRCICTASNNVPLRRPDSLLPPREIRPTPQQPSYDSSPTFFRRIGQKIAAATQAPTCTASTQTPAYNHQSHSISVNSRVDPNSDDLADFDVLRFRASSQSLVGGVEFLSLNSTNNNNNTTTSHTVDTPRRH